MIIGIDLAQGPDRTAYLIYTRSMTMTPETLKEASKLQGQIERLKERLSDLQLRKDFLEKENYQGANIRLGQHGTSTIALDDEDIELIQMVGLIAYARIEARINDLEKRFEAL